MGKQIVDGVQTEVLEEVKSGKVVFTTLSPEGDERLVWDASDPDQVKEALQIFDGYMDKGYLAFLIDDQGRQGEMINSTDWKRKDVRQREEILFQEPQEVHAVAPVQGG
jgi:hypothetical protein